MLKRKEWLVLPTAFSEVAGVAPAFVAVAHVLISIAASAHAVLYKRDSRSAFGWVGIIWLSPFLGAFLYYAFGINRIHRKARGLKSGAAQAAARALPVPEHPQAARIRFSNVVVGQPSVPGNRITALSNGDEAYPAMLAAIGAAKKSIALSTYIFDNDTVGRAFVAALADAGKRGVHVRVLVDGAGANYSFPRITRVLAQNGIRHALFLRALLPWDFRYLNLRNHRKALVIDGEIGFTGGMNIRRGNLTREYPDEAIQDLHFHLEGPIVGQLQNAFATDWKFTTKETLEGDLWFPPLSGRGETLARGIPDGPGEDFEKIRWAILGALSTAKKSIRIVTPYFLPDSSLMTALNTAAIAGVRVQILLPQKNNLPYVHWAMLAVLPELVERGCQVFLSAPPFDHSKLLIVDGEYVLLGSANWDPRSLRLNFEYCVECYDASLATTLDKLYDSKLSRARPLLLGELESAPLWKKVRNGVTRLFTPYL